MSSVVEEIGTDADGFKVAQVDGFKFRLTPCCSAATTGTDYGIVCKACFELSDFRVEDEPREPIRVDHIVAAEEAFPNDA